MKKVVKIFIILIIIILTTKIQVKAFSMDDVMTRAKEFTSSSSSARIPESNIKDLSNSVYNILFVIGVAAAVVFAAVLGVKFIIGSAEEQAEVKKFIVPYIVGCIIVFGAFGIWAALVNTMQSTGL